MYGFMREPERVNIRLFGILRPKGGLFRQEEDHIRSIFSERSDIRPKSDKADLFGSTRTSTWHY